MIFQHYLIQTNSMCCHPMTNERKQQTKQLKMCYKAINKRLLGTFTAWWGDPSSWPMVKGEKHSSWVE